METKTLTFSMMDGTLNGRVMCSIQFWPGVAYRIPRENIDGRCEWIRLDRFEDWKYLNYCGVYLLLGVGDDGKPYVYVGQADEKKKGGAILARLKRQANQQNPGLRNWSEAVAFSTSDNFFGSSHISWLEHHFFTLASRAKRYEVRNNNVPSAGNVKADLRSGLLSFAENARIIMNVLGLPVFEPLSAAAAAAHGCLPSAEPGSLPAPPSPGRPAGARTFDCEIRTTMAEAFGRRVNGGIVLLKGSRIRMGDLPKSCPGGAARMRRDCASKIDAEGTLKEDIAFDSLSSAASFVLGASVSGKTLWKPNPEAPPPAPPEKREEAPAVEARDSALVGAKRRPQASFGGGASALSAAALKIRRPGIEAYCRPESGGFLVLKGSRIRAGDLPRSCPDNVRRERLANASRIGGGGRLKEDIMFGSLSAAAGFVIGGSVSGKAAWEPVSSLASSAGGGPRGSAAPEGGASGVFAAADLEIRRADVEAYCRRANGGVSVLKGSRVRMRDLPKSCPDNVRRLRLENASKIDGEGRLKETIFFGSLSVAASFVVGGSISGKAAWEPVSRGAAPSGGGQGVSAASVLQIKRGAIEAYGRFASGGFLLLKGSRIRAGELAKCCLPHTRKQRKAYASKVDGEGLVTEDILLPNEGAAACFVLGSKASGIAAWKTPEGRSLRSILAGG
ncbi:MAG: GIY-YIG nuclease family protein [Deltaproteobacteria bacterium]|jgi:hypothetical protein|nr:GIY-YIG nuclease family protein [Deltaproteobacteria bacterium]